MQSYTGATDKYWIAQTFALDNSLQSEIKRFFNYQNYAQDIIQDILLQILNIQNEEKILQVCQKNKFNVWLFSALNNQKKNPQSYTNKFYVNRITLDIIPEPKETYHNIYMDRVELDHKAYLIDLIKSELLKINEKSWYQKKVFDDYVELKEKYRQQGKKLTFEQFGIEQNINKDSLFQIIKKVKIKLINKIKDEL